jgi:hypothetical protein
VTAALIKSGSSDIARWADPANLARSWSNRAKAAAARIKPASRVLDLGAGNMDLLGFLRPGCKYIPADIVSRGPDCFVVDLNADEYPAIDVDVTTLLGVIEYLHRPDRVLRKAAKRSKMLIASYVTNWHGSVQQRRGMGWVNDFRRDDLVKLFSGAGWSIAEMRTLKPRWRNWEYLVVATRGNVAPAQ